MLILSFGMQWIKYPLMIGCDNRNAELSLQSGEVAQFIFHKSFFTRSSYSHEYLHSTVYYKVMSCYRTNDQTDQIVKPMGNTKRHQRSILRAIFSRSLRAIFVVMITSIRVKNTIMVLPNVK